MMSFTDLQPGLQTVRLQLREFFPDPGEMARFLNSLDRFMQSDSAHDHLFEVHGQELVYRTEQLVPTLSDQQTPLLLLFGNPARHSVRSGMFFASEGNGRDHRLWRALETAGIFSLGSGEQPAPPDEVRQLSLRRKDAILNLSYSSPFRVGFAVFYSMPSPASGSRWAGVSGLHHIWGQPAFSRLQTLEAERINRLIRSFVKPRGAVFAFQKDAYSALCSPDSPPYSQSAALDGHLLGTYTHDPSIRIFGCPPTRFMYSPRAVAALCTYRKSALSPTCLSGG